MSQSGMKYRANYLEILKSKIIYLAKAIFKFLLSVAIFSSKMLSQ